MTKRDVSVWIIACWLLVVNLTTMAIFGGLGGALYGNAFGLGTTALFVWCSKHNKKLNDWLNTPA